MKLPALDLDDLDVAPFDVEEFTWLDAQPAPQLPTTGEPAEDPRWWYDIGYVGVVREGSSHPDGYETATTAELMAYWMGQSDAALGKPRSFLD
jgi:hypothetical protein